MDVNHRNHKSNVEFKAIQPSSLQNRMSGIMVIRESKGKNDDRFNIVNLAIFFRIPSTSVLFYIVPSTVDEAIHYGQHDVLYFSLRRIHPEVPQKLIAIYCNYPKNQWLSDTYLLFIFRLGRIDIYISLPF